MPLLLTTAAAGFLTNCSPSQGLLTSLVGIAGVGAVLKGVRIFLQRPPHPTDTTRIEFDFPPPPPLPTMPFRFQDLSPQQKPLARALGYGEADTFRDAGSNRFKEPPGGLVPYVPMSVYPMRALLLKCDIFRRIRVPDCTWFGNK